MASLVKHCGDGQQVDVGRDSWFSAEACQMLEDACDNPAVGPQNAERGGKWIVGNYGNTLYNHGLMPNSTTIDCLNATQQKGQLTARSRHPGGLQVGFCDGHVRFVSDAIDAAIWRSLATRQGAERHIIE